MTLNKGFGLFYALRLTIIYWITLSLRKIQFAGTRKIGSGNQQNIRDSQAIRKKDQTSGENNELHSMLVST